MQQHTPTPEQIFLTSRELTSRHLEQTLHTALEKRAKPYDGERLRAVEQKRDQETQKRIARYRAVLIDGPRLTIPLQKMQMSFDPKNRVHEQQNRSSYGRRPCWILGHLS